MNKKTVPVDEEMPFEYVRVSDVEMDIYVEQKSIDHTKKSFMQTKSNTVDSSSDSE